MPKGKNSFNFLNQFIIVVAYFELEILLPTNRNSNFDILNSKVEVIYFCNTKQTKNNFFLYLTTLLHTSHDMILKISIVETITYFS